MDLKQRYYDRVDEPGGEKQRQRNLGKLENYGFIESRGATKDTVYRYIDLE